MSTEVTEVPTHDVHASDRFHLGPRTRLEAFAATAGVIGAGAGFYERVKMLSLRYLTENAHRLPTTVGGWYFYHKKKNYVMITLGVKQACRTGIKYGAGVGGFFGLEAAIDYARGSIDFLNTAAAATIYLGLYGAYHRLSRVQIRNYVVRGGVLGLSLGLAQDMLIYARGGDVWYMQKLGIKRPQRPAPVVAPQ